MKHRSLTLAITTAAAALATTVGLTTGATQAAPAPAAAASRGAVPATHLTLQIPGCEGCRVALTQGEKRTEDDWSSSTKTVRDNHVGWTIASSHTHGMTVSVIGPWEHGSAGDPGYLTLVAFRYGHQKVGTAVPDATAHRATRASACWAGTDAAEETLVVQVREVDSKDGKSAGTIAWASPTLPWLKPMQTVGHGIYGTQAVVVCQS